MIDRVSPPLASRSIGGPDVDDRSSADRSPLADPPTTTPTFSQTTLNPTTLSPTPDQAAIDQAAINQLSLDQGPLSRHSVTDLADLEVAEAATVPAAERLDEVAQTRLEVPIPGYLLDEVSWVAEAERCDIAEIVVNALDLFLADHWVRHPD
jgi:hypothetical protein